MGHIRQTYEQNMSIIINDEAVQSLIFELGNALLERGCEQQEAKNDSAYAVEVLMAYFDESTRPLINTLHSLLEGEAPTELQQVLESAGVNGAISQTPDLREAAVLIAMVQKAQLDYLTCCQRWDSEGKEQAKGALLHALKLANKQIDAENNLDAQAQEQHEVQIDQLVDKWCFNVTAQILHAPAQQSARAH